MEFKILFYENLGKIKNKISKLIGHKRLTYIMLCVKAMKCIIAIFHAFSISTNVVIYLNCMQEQKNGAMNVQEDSL